MGRKETKREELIRDPESQTDPEKTEEEQEGGSLMPPASQSGR